MHNVVDKETQRSWTSQMFDNMDDQMNEKMKIDEKNNESMGVLHKYTTIYVEEWKKYKGRGWDSRIGSRESKEKNNGQR